MTKIYKITLFFVWSLISGLSYAQDSSTSSDIVIGGNLFRSSHEVAHATSNQSTGSKTVRIILIDYPNKSSVSTRDEIDFLFRRSTDNIPQRFATLSRSALNLVVDQDGDGYTDVFGPYLYDGPLTFCNGFRDISRIVYDKFTAERPRAPQTDLLLFVFPSDPDCDHYGFGTIAPQSPAISWYADDSKVTFLHEIGHNLGLEHSNGLKSGVVTEYADDYCIMGRGFSDFNAPHLNQLQWFEPGEVQTAPLPLPGESHQYLISTLDMRFSDPRKSYGLIIDDPNHSRKLMVSVQKLLSFLSYRETRDPGDPYIRFQFRGDRITSEYVMIHDITNSKSVLIAKLISGRDFTDTVSSIKISAQSSLDDHVIIRVSGNIPGDFDGDGIPDVIDSDDDNDGVPDSMDCAPTNPYWTLPFGYFDFDYDGAADNDELLSLSCDQISDFSWYIPYKPLSSPVIDNCRTIYNPGQENSSRETLGDYCNPEIDTDGDGVSNDRDCEPLDPTRWRIISSTIGYYYSDLDHDGIADDSSLFLSRCVGATLPKDYKEREPYSKIFDNCPTVPNPDQKDADHDGQGDACDDDRDGDHILNEDDCEPDVPSARSRFGGYVDADQDGFADNLQKVTLSCDGVSMFQGHLVKSAVLDNCVGIYNPDQFDSDGDGVGDLCEVTTLLQNLRSAIKPLKEAMIKLSKVADLIKFKKLLAKTRIDYRTFKSSSDLLWKFSADARKSGVSQIAEKNLANILKEKKPSARTRENAKSAIQTLNLLTRKVHTFKK